MLFSSCQWQSGMTATQPSSVNTLTYFLYCCWGLLRSHLMTTGLSGPERSSSPWLQRQQRRGGRDRGCREPWSKHTNTHTHTHTHTHRYEYWKWSSWNRKLWPLVLIHWLQFGGSCKTPGRHAPVTASVFMHEPQITPQIVTFITDHLEKTLCLLPVHRTSWEYLITDRKSKTHFPNFASFLPQNAFLCHYTT